MTGACLAQDKKKRKLADVDLEEFRDEIGWPVWIVSENTFRLWRAGRSPPAEVRLSPQAAAEVARLKAWADEQVEEEERPTSSRVRVQAPPPPPLPPPPHLPVQVKALHPAMVQFDPTMLRTVAMGGHA